jgi:hypothetical protein
MVLKPAAGQLEHQVAARDLLVVVDRHFEDDSGHVG